MFVILFLHSVIWTNITALSDNLVRTMKKVDKEEKYIFYYTVFNIHNI